jgi:hypothetical protein
MLQQSPIISLLGQAEALLIKVATGILLMASCRLYRRTLDLFATALRDSTWVDGCDLHCALCIAHAPCHCLICFKQHMQKAQAWASFHHQQMTDVLLLCVGLVLGQHCTICIPEATTVSGGIALLCIRCHHVSVIMAACVRPLPLFPFDMWLLPRCIT